MRKTDEIAPTYSPLSRPAFVTLHELVACDWGPPTAAVKEKVVRQWWAFSFI